MPILTSRSGASRSVITVFGAVIPPPTLQFGPRQSSSSADVVANSASKAPTSSANLGADCWGVAPQAAQENSAADIVSNAEADILGWTIDDTISALLAEAAKTAEPKDQWLNQFIGVVILLNMVTMALEVDIGPDVESGDSQDEYIWFGIEVVFCLCYMCELGLRIYLEKWRWVRSLWNWLDCGIVVSSMVENIVVQVTSADGMGLQMLVLLRIVRLARLVRVVRLIRMFRGVYVTVMAFRNAITSMAYICFLMVVGLFVCAIFTTRMIGRSPLCHVRVGNDATGCDYFGTMLRSTYSLFELMTLEGWENVGRPIVMEQPGMAVFFFCFIMCFTFGLLNMVVAVVVEKTLAQALRMEKADEKQLKMQAAEELQRIKTIFHELDVTGSGNIRRREFFNALRTKPEVCQSFEALGIPTSDAWSLYSILDGNGDNLVSREELLEGCARIRGLKGNSDWDLMTIKGKLGRVARQVEKLSVDMHKVLNMPGIKSVVKDASMSRVAFNVEEVLAPVAPAPLLPGTAGEPDGQDPGLREPSVYPVVPVPEPPGSSQPNEGFLSTEAVICRRKMTARTRAENPGYATNTSGHHYVSTGESLSSLGVYRTSGRSDGDFSNAGESEVVALLARVENKLGSFQDMQVQALEQVRNEADVRAAEQDSILRRIGEDMEARAKSHDDRLEALMVQVAKLQSLVVASVDSPPQHEGAPEVSRRSIQKTESGVVSFET